MVIYQITFFKCNLTLAKLANLNHDDYRNDDASLALGVLRLSDLGHGLDSSLVTRVRLEQDFHGVHASSRVVRKRDSRQKDAELPVVGVGAHEHGVRQHDEAAAHLLQDEPRLRQSFLQRKKKP